MFVTRSSNGPLVAERRTPVAPKPPEPAKPLSQQPEVRFVAPAHNETPRPVVQAGALSAVQHGANKVYGMVSKFT
ncbi:hypothetical protein [Novosphingobium sp. JCM 18896]|uniref:hypothetical protein n=1 Tax=Novosphingobium sp. JCM 18896 TaxID=2989731 RepID=UPI0022221E0A|nr:hypothetical protein [Novosphingobium sp. JCM 18896]MCW1431308.1 hypothetical protein [Novosphingobium sp. JCM 18896]